ncbi:MAG: aldolase/citrate lyase family protein [Sphingomonadaceae bacterium]
MQNKALAKWRSGEHSIGAWINLPDIHITETLARMDYDWLCFDLQHGLLSYSHLLALLPAISATETTPLVRVADGGASAIGRALDAGITVGLFGYSPELAHGAKAQGFDFVSAGSDISFMRQGAASAFATVSGQPEVAARAGY